MDGMLLAGAAADSSAGEAVASAACCSSRVMDPSCLFTTDEGESVRGWFSGAAAAEVAALCDCLSRAAEEEEGEEEEGEGAARRPRPGGSASRSNLCKRLHTKLMGSR